MQFVSDRKKENKKKRGRNPVTEGISQLGHKKGEKQINIIISNAFPRRMFQNHTSHLWYYLIA